MIQKTNVRWNVPKLDALLFIRLQLVGILLWIGFILILPMDTFHTSPGWALFLRTGWSEVTWALIFFGGGLLGAIGIWTRKYRAEISSAILLSTYHFVIALMFLIGNPASPGAGLFGIMSISGYYLVWRLLRS